ncbi:MAG: hypothetical protein ACM3S5_17915 [Rhodospirillales bacterium]
MSTTVRPHSHEYAPAVKEFNLRIAAATGSTEFFLPEHPAQGESENYFLALEDYTVRGGYILRRQEFSVRGKMVRLAHYRQPVSEGTWNRAFAGVGPQMLRAALAEEPLLFALGMGGGEFALPRMLRAMRWRLMPVPFFFKVLDVGRFLREIRLLRKTQGRRFVAEAARVTGTGWLAIRAAQRLVAIRRAKMECELEQFRGFGGWADAIWERAHRRYALIGLRDSGVLNQLYPASNERFLGLRVSRGGRTIGWAIALDTQMRNHRHFGNLRVGTIADCMALPEDAAPIAAAAERFLRARGCELIVSNQAHRAWTNALGACGFLRGPSNFVFAVASKLAGLLEPFEATFSEMHLNRGDGDGPIHL